MEGLIGIGMVVAVCMAGLGAIAFMMSRLYVRATPEWALVRSGYRGKKVVIDGGCFVLPVYHEIQRVNMKTVKLAVTRQQRDSLITKDRLRVDVIVEFYVRAKPDATAIPEAARTLGERTADQAALKDLIEGKAVGVLRAVAARMTMAELHEDRAKFEQEVLNGVQKDLTKNGLELESSAMTHFNQTAKEFFVAENAFDAEGLAMLTAAVEQRRQEVNNIEVTTRVAIETRNLEGQRRSLQLAQDTQEAMLTQQLAIETATAQRKREIAQQQAEQDRLAQEAQIAAQQQVQLASVEAERTVQEAKAQQHAAVQQAQIASERAVKVADEQRQRDVAVAAEERQRDVEVAKQERNIKVQTKSEELSGATASAERARAEAVVAEQQVITAQAVASADREKQVAVIAAEREAQQGAVGLVVNAKAHEDAAAHEAAAVMVRATADTDAKRLALEIAERDFAVRATGTRLLHESENVLGQSAMDLRLRLALVEHAAAMITAAGKPVEHIKDLRVIAVQGIPGLAGPLPVNGDGSTVANGTGHDAGLPDQIVNAALRHQALAPLVGLLMGEIGIDPTTMNGIARPLTDMAVARPAHPANGDARASS